MVLHRRGISACWFPIRTSYPGCLDVPQLEQRKNKDGFSMYVQRFLSSWLYYRRKGTYTDLLTCSSANCQANIYQEDDKPLCESSFGRTDLFY